MTSTRTGPLGHRQEFPHQPGEAARPDTSQDGALQAEVLRDQLWHGVPPPYRVARDARLEALRPAHRQTALVLDVELRHDFLTYGVCDGDMSRRFDTRSWTMAHLESS